MAIQSVERAIDILQAIATRRTAMGLPELSETLGLPKTTIHSLIKTLRDKGMVQQDPATKKYGLGFALFELGAIQVAELELQRIASPVTEQLANKLDSICRLGVWNQQSVIVTQYAYPVGRSRTGRPIGPRIPAYCTALGKAILAFLPEQEVNEYIEQIELVAYTEKTITSHKRLRKELEQILKRKYSISHAELVPYRSAMGAPVFGPTGHVEGAVSISLEPDTLQPDQLEPLSNHLLQATHEISESLGYPAMNIRHKR